MDVVDRHLRLRQRGEPVNRVVLRQRRRECGLTHLIGSTRFRQSRIAQQVDHGIDAGNTRDAHRVLDSPVVEHQPTATACQQTRLHCHATRCDQMAMELAEDATPHRTAIRFANVDTGNSNTSRKELIEHPLLRGARQPLQSRRIPDPRNATALLRATRRDGRRHHQEGATTGDDQFLGRDHLMLLDSLRG